MSIQLKAPGVGTVYDKNGKKVGTIANAYSPGIGLGFDVLGTININGEKVPVKVVAPYIGTYDDLKIK